MGQHARGKRVYIRMYRRSQRAGERNLIMSAQEKNKRSLTHISRLHTCNTPTLEQPTYLHTAYNPTNPTPYAPFNPTLHAYSYKSTHYLHTNPTHQPYKRPYTLHTYPTPTYLPYTPTNPTTCLHACHASDSRQHYLPATPAI